MELNPSISLLIEAHGEEIGLLNKQLQSELHERVEIAYKITTNTFNFPHDTDFSVLRKEYFNTPIQKQRSNEKIMDLFLENCNKIIPSDTIFKYEIFTKPHYKTVINSTKRMISEDRRCYRGHSVVDRLYYFDDQNFYNKFNFLTKFLPDNTPFMGSIYVLRASFLDGSVEQGDLLQSTDLFNPQLNELRKLIQSKVVEGKNRISAYHLLTIIKSFFEKIYIYDFGCRARSKEFNIKINPEYPEINPLLPRQLTNFVYNSERKPYLKRVFSRKEQDFNRELFELILDLFNTEAKKLVNGDGTKFKDIYVEKTFIDFLETKQVQNLYPDKDPEQIKELLPIILNEFFKTKEWKKREWISTSEMLENIEKIYLEMLKSNIENENGYDDDGEEKKGTLFRDDPKIETFIKYFDRTFFNKKYSIYEDFNLFRNKYEELIISYFENL